MKNHPKKITVAFLTTSLLFASISSSYAQDEQKTERTKKENNITITKIINEHPYLTAFILLCTVDALTNNNRQGLQQLMREHPYLTVFIMLQLINH